MAEKKKAALFVELPSGQLKASTLAFSAAELLLFGAQLKARNPQVRVYLKDCTGLMQEIE